MKKIIIFAILILLTACTAKSNHNLNSVLWVQTAAEYQANCYQAYNAAMNNIEAAIADNQWTAAIKQTGDYSDLPPAVIFDLDETVLNNAQYQAQLLIDEADFQLSAWDQWVKLRKARAIAGAVDFINFIQARGIEAIFITNRECHQRNNRLSACPQKSDSIENLRNLGITGIDSNNVLLKNEYSDWDSEKQSRRGYVMKKYRILMIFGDDLGDFIADVKKEITPEKRKEIVTNFKENWGKKWFILPNPMYGSWNQILTAPRYRYLNGIFNK